jgi:hypothetical protein
VHLNIERPICLTAHADEDVWVWHARFGHQGFDGLNKLATKGMVCGMPCITHVEQLCEACLARKHRRAPFPQVAKNHATAPLELVHGDLCGPISPVTPAGNCYFLLLVDDYSRFMWIKLLCTKDEAADAICQFQAGVEVESQHTLRVFRTDRGSEFTVGEFMDWCADRGIKCHLTTPYSPQQNSVVKHRNQTVLGTTWCMLKGMGVLARFWGKAVSTIVFLLNRSHTRSIEGRTPYEAWHGIKPDVKFPRVFGCRAHAKVMKPDLKKLDDRSKPMVMVGYEPGRKAYRLYNPATKRVLVSRDVVFDKGRGWNWDGSDATDGEDVEFTVEYSHEATLARFIPISPSPASPAQPALSTTPTAHSPVVPTPPTWSASSSAMPAPAAQARFISPPASLDPELYDEGDDPAAPHRYRSVADLYQVDDVDHVHDERLLLTPHGEPTTAAEAEQDEKWHEAMSAELASIEENNTWSLTDLPVGKKPIGLKWVFKLKRITDGNMLKHKVRLVAKGYVQWPGIDFDEVFAPVARLDSVRLLLAVATQKKWEVHHMDVKTAFLNSELGEEVYVAQPSGFINTGESSKVLRVHKALYGLRQAPHVWNIKLDEVLTSLGFERSP